MAGQVPLPARPGAGLPPVRWNRESGLRNWLDAAHDGHARRLDEAAPNLPSRAELVESTVQLAPLIMIDGGWLRGSRTIGTPRRRTATSCSARTGMSWATATGS
ncbi:hypothetical protein NKH77_50585 [Streptomyces sp. M19]